MKICFKKFFAVALIASMCLSVMTACGGSTLLPFMPEETGPTDFGGYVCKIVQSTNSDSTGVIIDENNPFGYKENTVLADAVKKRLADVETALNCKIELSLTDASIEHFRNMLFADNVNEEILFSATHALMKSLANGGYLEAADDYPDRVDITDTEKYGPVNVQELNAANGHIYALAPVTWIYKQPRAVELIVVNEDLRAKVNGPHPGEYVENGTWDWTAFESFIANSSMTEGETRIYSFAARDFDMVKLFAYGNGVKLAYESSDAAYETDFGATNMMEAVDFYYMLMNRYYDNFSHETGDWADVLEEFAINQNSVACLTAAPVLYNDISYYVESYSIAPFPTGPSGEYGKWPSAIEATETFSVFRTGVEPEMNFSIIDMICEPFEGYETEESRLDYLMGNVLYTLEDAEFLMNLYKNGVYTYWTVSSSNGYGFDELWRRFADGPSTCDSPKSPSQVLGEMEKVYYSLIETYMVPNFPIYEMIPN